ncbi:MAG: TlpA family protein disulfide reductase [Deltaproteobacteria bacterium]|nr:TlpA family protein disulfide reductase [Deltaproteobacteria bacterium]
MASVLLLSVFFVRMLRPAAEREVVAACAAMRSAPKNDALGGTLPQAVPQFQAQDHTGKLVSIADFRGKTTLVNFWASWCEVCALEKPTLVELQNEMGGEIEIVTLASDDDWAEIQKLFPDGPPFRVLLDPPGEGGNIGRVARSFGVTAVPETFLVDKNGVVQHYYINKRNWSSSVAKTCLRSFLDEQS